MLEIVKAEYKENFLCAVSFNDGREGVINISALAADEPQKVFAPLNDERVARSFALKHGTLCWAGEVDVAPEYLYFLAFHDEPELYDQFVAWGYLQNRAHA